MQPTTSTADKVLFICTGNFYRSRFAEIYFNHLAQVHGLAHRAFSRGFEVWAARNKGPLSRHTLGYLDEIGVPAPEPAGFPVQLCEEDFARASRIIALDRDEHLPMVLRDFPHRLPEVEFWAFADVPFADPEVVLPAVRRQVEDLFPL